MPTEYTSKLSLTMQTLNIFTDAATSPQAGIAVGAFLCLSEQQLDELADCSKEILSAKLASDIVYIKYDSNKSTWSEIKTAINALIFASQNVKSPYNIRLYTDCQTLCDLLGKRKDKLLKNNFITRAGKILQHANLYKELFEMTDKLQIQIFKIKGHQAISSSLTLQEKIFGVLDKCSRNKLRSFR